jgi:hypothetical protein
LLFLLHLLNHLLSSTVAVSRTRHNSTTTHHLSPLHQQGTKRVKFMGRGRTGIKFIRTSHLNLTLAEIDFDANVKTKKIRRMDGPTD